jgi:hypothetical protein
MVTVGMKTHYNQSCNLFFVQQYRILNIADSLCTVYWYEMILG